MSSFSIAIPKRRKKVDESSSGSTGGSSAGSVFASSFGSFGSVRAEDEVAREKVLGRDRRPSLMSPAFSRAEHTVINVGNSEMPRLITCVKASQGFDWNQDIFLPSYANFDSEDLERKPDPVQDIIVTDEEVANMFPS